MQKKINDFVINVATVNGSGSQSANTILIKSIFRMGIPVGGKNIFPSNIMGLPTWFMIRANKNGYSCMKRENDMVVAMNIATIMDDLKSVNPGGVFLYNEDLKLDSSLLRSDTLNIAVPFRKLVDQATDQLKLKKLLTNTIYVGILSHLLEIDYDTLVAVIKDQFADKAAVVASNLKAIDVGRAYAKEKLTKDTIGEFPLKLEKMDKTQGKILIDGNTAAGLGLMYGGCTFASWYPITPSTSLVESFARYANQHRKDKDGKNTFAVIQAEDELSAICMVLGAGWAGARAMTATSGPGVSLMAEASGLSYYAEIPTVIWDIQRTGPSTGLPTRTQQADVAFAAHLSHGDTEHILLFPATPEECFEFGQTCFDLAEKFQTMVIVLSDIDLGMNLWITDEFKYPTKPFERGKVVREEELKKMAQFFRYQDKDGDGIPYRSLPGTHHPAAGFLTRGSGHNEKAQYTENNVQYQTVLDRLVKKFETAKKHVPKPIIDNQAGAKVGVLAFGSTHWPIVEARDHMKAKGLATDYLRLRAMPFSPEVHEFIKSHERIYVVEQNRDSQMLNLLLVEYPEYAMRLKSVRNYDGLPLDAIRVSEPILKMEKLT